MTFWPGQGTRVDKRVFAVGRNAIKVASRALGDIFSGSLASKMEFPAYLHQLENTCNVMQTPSRAEVRSRTRQRPEVRRDGQSIGNTVED
jgi:hypothetical protein